jgi:hypothetical protein
MYTLATLHHLRQRLGLAASDTADDVKLLAALQAASAQIERLANRRFSPRQAVIEHDANPRHVTELLLDDDLLELTTLSNGDGSTIAPANIVTLPDSNADSPTSVIRLTGGHAFIWDITPLRAIQVSGIWGWHDRYTQAWRSSADTVQNNPLGSSATTLTVADADGADSTGESPRFQVGQLLRIDSEYLRVLAVNTASNILTVLRGVNGTTATTHNQNTAISVYLPPLDIQLWVVRYAAWLYKEPDSKGFTPSPAALIKELDPLRRVGVKA